MSDQDELRLPEWGPGKTAKGRARLPSSRRRDRPQFSCNLCKQRKLRCDRQYPCGACGLRGLGQSCTYVPNESRPVGGEQRARTVQDRILQLESLVVDLMQKTSESHAGQELLVIPGRSSTTGHLDDATKTAGFASPLSDSGSMQLTGSGASYVNGSHWAAILEEIVELKDYFDKEEESPAIDRPSESSFPDWTGPQLLYGCRMLATKEEMLAAVPTRQVVDRLVSRYFSSFEMSPAVLHSVQFLEEYEDFWRDPSETPVIWLGLLFTIMCLAAQFQKFRLDPCSQTPTNQSLEQDLQNMVETFRRNIVQCLILGNYAKGGPYVLETLMLYIAVELLSRNDAEMGVCILLGTIVQLAMHMGYHRDPKHFKSMSAFTGEMRKRVWATIVELDIGISTQMGLPRLIKQWQTDTTEPLNLQDSDFNKTTTDMPPCRPETDLTPMLYRLVKARFMATIGSIWDFATDIRSYAYDDVMKMDKKLQETYISIPTCLKWRSMALCILDSPQIIMQKMFLEIMFHRAKIVLHRKYLHCSPMMTQYGYSQQACLDAALKLLDYQHVLQEETRPFCQLYQERWRVSSLVNHDFLLATSILCLYLQHVDGVVNESVEASMVEGIWASLKRSYDIWLDSSSSSKEAQKAVKALSIVLGSHNACGESSNVETNAPQSTSHGIDTSYYNHSSSTEFGIQFPILDEAVLTDWTSPAIEPPGSLQIATPASDVGWQMWDAVDTLDTLQQPWEEIP
ncbi:fungal-specific transcription factor domain-containing protein [Dothidotthia symphoricarpi CBS 119687]|uniref:Fungal-specific transcription factor domain-containing protein n=1 Tax=Dothidotthia symphoricarpi CBS 119687 TaxID=1392245 RepID=A0A6A6ANV8_9PLEO|nr:fungal-specific transcription factor domain-containing protein [Dothidotthia symphoricarpi CBS 119687]KAF2132735.1 fungal-specific transcription factor domain-containing protein [Dothidotthia symphoricarpi CBS 119687]